MKMILEIEITDWRGTPETARRAGILVSVALQAKQAGEREAADFDVVASVSSRIASASTHMGGSLLPSSGPDTYKVKAGPFGSFETRPLPDLDTHGLFLFDRKGIFYREASETPRLIATHPNGYSCDELAKRIIAAWESVEPWGADAGRTKAMEQFDYILACGGMGISRETVSHIVNGPR